MTDVAATRPRPARGRRRRSWEESYAELRAYASEHATAWVPQAYRGSSGAALGWWVTAQRRLHRDGCLHPHRVRLLEALPGWSWGAPQVGWDRYLCALRAFAEREGSTRVPKGHVEDGVALARWVVEQRSAGRRGQLSSAQRSELDAVPGWVWDPLADSWDSHFGAASAWLSAGNRGSSLGGSARHAGIPVGRWADDQRRRARSGKLDQARRERLEALPGWEWQPADARWRERFCELEAVVERGGPLPQALSWWCCAQRSAYTEGTLAEPYVKMLGALDGWSWSPLADSWYGRLEQLRSHVAATGSVTFSNRRAAGPDPLSFWVSRQRRSWRDGRLEADRVAALETIPTWVW